MPRGITAEIGRWLGFGYDKGPPRIWTLGWVVISVHDGVVLRIGSYALALRRANDSIDAKDAEIARLEQALAGRLDEIEAMRTSSHGGFSAICKVVVENLDRLEGSNDR
ncbi:hypothetical protein AA101099_1795 [Neoasaia chiangmaiensis NBRC 101099]|uniref:Uncharacterized protein n=1 Tax=Neoasaia chiangmaiensis TaxID=320497 RepID=A0A1U9KQZ6_9PROT|nr:hypothetical protein [Neoasaia chiangmaiensis]AQS88248.1 hypothetical protein A0U93_10200 [Neoasaia chiangmaiensis]GBR39736.1 hypothetical protein AA101099_1795 [Neoasaia chiangmaiensis NBRC 101099]GEN14718.1 hypothetical protein NCH01_11490 [Neoasaia chiangmaiensis]